jgi:integrase
MNRPRKHDRHLPACMYHRHGAYYLVRRGVWTRLAADLPAALREYARRLETPRATGGMPALIDAMLPRILRHPKTGKPHAAETQRQYRHCAGLLREMLAQLDPADLARRDVLAVRTGLQDTPATANRALTVLRLILSAAVDDEIIASNPAVSVDMIPIPPRTRRLTDAEYHRIHAHADHLLRAVMDLCYATGQRVMDVAAIKSADATDAGVYFRQRKTGSELVVSWTPDLRAAVDAARALRPNALRPPYLFGFSAPTYAMIRKRWVAARTAAKVADATIHDIRAMAATDAAAQGIDARVLLGHTDARTTRIYLRDRVVPVVAGPVMRKRA